MGIYITSSISVFRELAGVAVVGEMSDFDALLLHRTAKHQQEERVYIGAGLELPAITIRVL